MQLQINGEQKRMGDPTVHIPDGTDPINEFPVKKMTLSGADNGNDNRPISEGNAPDNSW
jgi:hypothetical protein